MTPPWRLDLHVHSSFSPDGRDGVDRFVELAARAGVNGFALTDHNSVAGHSRLAELSRSHPELRLIPGVEVSTAQGHLLAYGVTEVPPRGRPVAETIDWVNDHGGVPVLAHPFRWVHGVGGSAGGTVKVPAVEILNGHNGPRPNRSARALAADRALGTTGGSDAHDATELGRAWTTFPEDADSPDALIEALRHARTRAEGRSATPVERTRSALRSFGLRLGRGFRPI